MEYPKIETLFERDKKTHKVTDVLRSPVFGLLKAWHWTEKIDGTNIRIMWNPETDTVTFGGRTDNAQLPAPLVAWLNEYISKNRLRTSFSYAPVILYGEGYGRGIQKAGAAYSDTQAFVLFDVLVAGKWWLAWQNVLDVAAKQGLRTVPEIGMLSLDEAIERVKIGFPSKIGVAPAEGLVGKPTEPLFDNRGHRLVVKIKTRDF